MHSCYLCESSNVRVTHRDETHKIVKTYGPFDLFICRACGSMGTANPPSPSVLADLYARYEDFRPEWYNSGAAAGALDAQYRFYAKQVESPGSWVDIGAGHGEVASIVASNNPNGTAIDIGPRPSGLHPSVGYLSIDLNNAHWGAAIGGQFDNVYSVAVWEHSLNPADFARECLSLVAPRGQLTLICPDYSSLARKALGRRWPYFFPGEHISIPSRKGARMCLAKAVDDLGIAADVSVQRLNVGYSIRYVLEVLRLKPLAAITPPWLAAPLPTGLLIARVRRS